MKYCDDIDCPNLNPNADDTNCDLGFTNDFVTPKSMGDIYPEKNWGYKMPRICRSKMLPIKFYKPIHSC